MDDDDVNAETDEQTRLPMRSNMDRKFRFGFTVALIMVTLLVGSR